MKTEQGACGKGAAQGARESAEGEEVRRVQKSVRRGEMREGCEKVVGPPRVSTCELTMDEGLIYREERRQKHGVRGSSEQVDAVHVWARELVSEIEGQI